MFLTLYDIYSIDNFMLTPKMLTTWIMVIGYLKMIITFYVLQCNNS